MLTGRECFVIFLVCICIVGFLECIALANSVDGVMFGSAIGGICAICGYMAKSVKGGRK